MVKVTLYKSGDEKADKSARDALRHGGFVINENACPKALNNQAPTPVAHFLGKGVAFGEQNIVSFAERVKREETRER